MILAWAVVLGLVVCLARFRGRAASQIAAIPLRSAWLALLAVVLQLPLVRAPGGPTEELGVEQALFLASHLLLLAFTWRNRRLRGIQILGLGVICNLAAILANGGFMPITPQTLVAINPGTTLEQWSFGTHYGYSKDVILSHAETRLWILTDILVVPPPFPWPTAFSLGDLLLAMGIVVLLQGPSVKEN
jgi:hypothetical protein